MRSLLFLILAFTSIQWSNAQQIDSTRLDFFPLHLADEWEYYTGYIDGVPGYTTVLKLVKLDTLMPNGKRYCQISDALHGGIYRLYRVDSLLRVWESSAFVGTDTCLGSVSEANYYRLNEPDSAIWQVCYGLGGVLANPPWLFRYNGMSSWPDFGATRQLMNFESGGTRAGRDTTIQLFYPGFILMRNFGIYFETEGDLTYRQLIGAIINGVKYGSLNDVAQQREPTPLTFQLYQNYPNPFNGSTTIKYIIAKRSHVRLTLYDALGREVAVLRNEEESAGDHTVSFSNDKFPSGVYFYQLTSFNLGDVKTHQSLQTKKLILLK